MIDPVDRAVRAIARRNSYTVVWAQHLLAQSFNLMAEGLDERERRHEVAVRGKQTGVQLWAPYMRSGRGARGRAGAAPVSD
ncbi:MAG: hypothetical protein ACR2GZ_11025 [Solirubrobacteraceae bacterium]